MCVFKRGSNYCDSVLFPYLLFESKLLSFFLKKNNVPMSSSKVPRKNIYILDFIFGSKCRKKDSLEEKLTSLQCQEAAFSGINCKEIWISL